jgi:hypothetical protein
MRRATLVPLLLGLALAAAGCSGKAGAETGDTGWQAPDAGVYATTIGVVVDEVGTGPPPVVFVVDRLCADAGQLTPSKLACETPIPASGKTALADAMADLAPVEFVAEPSSVVAEGGTVERGGLLIWLGPTKDERSGVRVGVNYATVVEGDRGAGVNLRMTRKHDQWVVTGSAGLGGCPA